MNQKRNQKEFDRHQELAVAGTSPSAIGDGYGRQLAAMQEQERQKSIAMSNFVSSVGSPARQKQLQAEQDEINAVYNTQAAQN